ncbi:MAG: three-Cys-motif partner protein TcmP [Candidatus Dadabacteria bacterium]|nr:three-Cys-motif partner protein TcmP [Candidatus Dadabacteria bacterium]MDE0477733.1 three-Cys-motif partner protein TcmP [Candidatus Dadabacteria bacterium]
MSSNDKFDWGDGLPKLEIHSRAKHEILREYIISYLKVVCQPQRMPEFKIALVDGFAGGGRYEGGKVGSPFVLMQSVDEAEYLINCSRNPTTQVNIRANYYFVEKNKNNYLYLRQSINDSEYKSKLGETLFLFRGEFKDYLKKIVESIKRTSPRGGGGAIFFLDQTGYTDVSIEDMQYIRKNLPQSEIIVTVSIDWLIDFIEDEESLKRTTDSIGITQYLDIDEIVRIKKEKSVEWRSIIESKFSVAFQKAAEYRFFIPFFIEPLYGHRGYWLLHLSSNVRAHNVMMQCIWDKGNFMKHYGKTGLDIYKIAYKPSNGAILPGMSFTEVERKHHKKGLIEKMPSYIWENGGGLLKEIVEDTCNNTAADLSLYKESLSEIWDQGDIDVRGKGGGKKKKREIHDSDIIIPNRQRSFLFFRNGD